MINAFLKNQAEVIYLNKFFYITIYKKILMFIVF